MVKRPSVQRLRKLLHLDLDSGHLTWLPRPDNPGFNVRCSGRRAGTFDKTNGYRKVMVDHRYYGEHVIVWTLAHGYWPPPGKEVDHIHGVRDDNRPSQLRLASSAQQTMNQCRHADARNPVKGVRQTPCGRWRASIVTGGKSVWLGSYGTVEEAAAARRRAEDELHDPAFRRAA